MKWVTMAGYQWLFLCYVREEDGRVLAEVRETGSLFYAACGETGQPSHAFGRFISEPHAKAFCERNCA
jgi:hypothetical protein